MNSVRNKATMLFREVCERQLQQAAELHDDSGQLLAFQRLLIALTELAVGLVDRCERLLHVLVRTPADAYVEMMRLAGWAKFELLSQAIDQIVALLKDEELSPKFDLAPLALHVKAVAELQAAVEAKYTEKAKAEEDDGAAQERLKQVKIVPKLGLRHACLRSALALTAISVLN